MRKQRAHTERPCIDVMGDSPSCGPAMGTNIWTWACLRALTILASPSSSYLCSTMWSRDELSLPTPEKPRVLFWTTKFEDLNCQIAW